MQSLTFPIRWKLLAGFVGLALLVLLVVLFTVSRILDSRIRENINANFQEASKIFNQLQDIRFRQLHQTTTLVADMPYIKTAVSTGDADAINSQVRQELLRLLRFDPLASGISSSELLTTSVDSVGFVMVFNRNGIPLNQTAGTDLPSYSVADKAGIRAALEGHSPRQPYIWKRKGRYFSVITVPVFL